MATSSSTSSVKVVIPAVNSAWKAYVEADKKISGDVRTALTTLAKVIAEQTAPATQVQKSIEGTGKVAGTLGYGSVKALPVWLLLDTAYHAKKTASAEWKALSIDKQITLATKAYSLLGKDKYPVAPTFQTLMNDTNDAQAEKTRKAAEARKAKESKESAEESTGAKVKKTANLSETLNAIRLMVSALNEGAVTFEHVEIWDEITEIFASKQSYADAE